MLQTLLRLFGGSVLETIADRISEAYQAKLVADTDEKKLAAEMVIAELSAQQDILLKEQGRILTSWIRPALAVPVVVYWYKVIIWDTVLGLGVTTINDHIQWFVVLIPSVYFLLRPSEKVKEGVLDQVSNLFYRK